jgi:hypothetical protein
MGANQDSAAPGLHVCFRRVPAFHLVLNTLRAGMAAMILFFVFGKRCAKFAIQVKFFVFHQFEAVVALFCSGNQKFHYHHADPSSPSPDFTRIRCSGRDACRMMTKARAGVANPLHRSHRNDACPRRLPPAVGVSCRGRTKAPAFSQHRMGRGGR